jgi:homoserine kinase
VCFFSNVASFIQSYHQRNIKNNNKKKAEAKTIPSFILCITINIPDKEIITENEVKKGHGLGSTI